MVRKTIILFLIVGLAAAAYFLFVRGGGRAVDTDTADTRGEIDTNEEWQKYRNETLGIGLQYPTNWKVFEGDLFGTPIVNIYKKSEIKIPPFTHHSEVTQVSFFPNGVPTEGVWGEVATSAVLVNEDISQAIDFILEDKKPWATFLSFVSPPKSWQPYGFVWAEVSIDNLAMRCVLDDGREASQEECLEIPSPAGDLVRVGNIDDVDRETELRIISSLKFLD